NSAELTGSGNPPAAVHPGKQKALNLLIPNPNPAAITVGAGAIDIGIHTNTAACPASVNFGVVHGLAAAVTVPGGATQSLSGLSIPVADWPVVAMVETHTNQDACKGASLQFTFTGSALG